MNRYFALFFIPLFMFSCSKYEEGPKFTLKTKKSRLTGEWKLSSFNGSNEIKEERALIDPYTYNCGDQDPIYETIVVKSNIVWEFEGDNDLKEKYFNYVRQYNYGISYQEPDCVPIYNVVDSNRIAVSKSWEFSNNKSEIKILHSNAVEEYNIIKLSNSELKLETDLGDIYEFEKID